MSDEKQQPDRATIVKELRTLIGTPRARWCRSTLLAAADMLEADGPELIELSVWRSGLKLGYLMAKRQQLLEDEIGNSCVWCGSTEHNTTECQDAGHTQKPE